MNNKITLVESMAALRKQLHEIESKTINEGLNDAAKVVRAGEEIVPNIIKFWLKKPATEIIKEFKTIEITLPNGTKEIWNVTGIRNQEAMYSRASDNSIASFEDITKSGTVRNAKPDPYVVPEPPTPLPKARQNKDGSWEVKNEKGEWVKYEKPVEKPVDVGNPDPKYLDPPLFKNIEAAKSAADAEIQAGNAIVKAPDGTVFKSADDIESFIATNYPESAAAMAASPKKSMSLWSWFSPPRPPVGPGPRWTQTPPVPPEKPPAKHTKKTILLVALLIAAGLYFWPKNKTLPGGSESGSSEDGAKTSKDGSAPIGTEIPADQMPWKWVITGSTDPNVDLDEIKNAKEAHKQVKSQSVTKNQDGKWQTPNGRVLNADGPTAARLEQLAKMTPEKRKEMTRAEKSVIDNSVEMWPAGSLPDDKMSNPNPTPVLPPISTAVPVPQTSTLPAKPDIVIGKDDAEEKKKKDDAEKKKKKKDDKVLPSSKW